MNQPLTSTSSTLVKVTDAEKFEDLAALAKKCPFGNPVKNLKNAGLLKKQAIVHEKLSRMRGICQPLQGGKLECDQPPRYQKELIPPFPALSGQKKCAATRETSNRA